MKNMKTIPMILISLLALLMAAPAAEGQSNALIKTGSLTAASASCLATNCVSIPVLSNTGTVSFQLAGTFSATAQFEGTVDGTNYVALPAVPIAGGSSVTSATATGVWQSATTGLAGARVRLSAFTSGTAAAAVARSPVPPPINPVTLPIGVTAIAGAKPGVWTAGYSPAALTSGTDTLGIANQQWLAPVWVPTNMTITGIAYLIGSVGGTDKAIVTLYDSTGTKVANSTTTSSGTTVGTAGTLQSLAFTTAYAAKGPALFWVSVQTNGTTAKIRTVPLGAAFTGLAAAGGAAPLATITPPTAFTADTGPVAVLY